MSTRPAGARYGLVPGDIAPALRPRTSAPAMSATVGAAATIPSSVREFLATGPCAHVVTLTKAGVPHVNLTWGGLDGDQLVFASFFDSKRVHRVRRRPLVTASFEAKNYEDTVLHPYLVIRGRATVTEGGALEVMDRLSEFYLGPGALYPMRDGPPGWVFRVDIDEIDGMGPWNPRWMRVEERGEG